MESISNTVLNGRVKIYDKQKLEYQIAILLRKNGSGLSIVS